MGNKLCSCEFCFNENIEANLGTDQNAKTTNRKTSIINHNISKSSFNNCSNAFKRNSSGSTNFQDTVLMDKKVKEITIKNKANKIASCYKHYNSLRKEKEKEKTSITIEDSTPQAVLYESKESNDNMNPVVNIGSSSLSSIGHRKIKEKETKKNAPQQNSNNDNGFIYGDDCSFKGSVTDLKKNDLHYVENKREVNNEENHRYSIMKNEDNKNNKNAKEEKITNTDVMQLIGMFSGNDNGDADNDNKDGDKDDNRYESDNDNLSFE